MNERFIRAGAVARVDLAHEPDFALGCIEVRPARREIVGDGLQETLEPRAMRVMVALARVKGEILSRDDLIESCWDGVVVGEDAINRCIGRLRKAAEASGNAFSIETVPRVGYRMRSAEVAAPPARPEEGDTAGANTAAAPTLPDAPVQSSWLRRNRPYAVAGIALLVAAMFDGWWFWPRPESFGPEASVAVLPFANMSGDAAKEYFSDGFSQELINDLSYDPHLRVVARTSAFAFKGKNEDIGTIARALHVRAIVEGSVREVGNRVRITAQLVSANDGHRIWSASYDRNLTDILSVQDEIAHAITASLTSELLQRSPRIKTGRPATISAEAYRAYLQGLSLLAFQDADDGRKAIPFFQKATALQPDFARAHAWLAGAYIVASLDRFATQDRSALFSAAGVAAKRALELAPDDVAALGIHLNLSIRDGDWAGAVADADRMQKINPNGPLLPFWMAPYYSFLGFPERALISERAEVALDPLSFPFRRAVVWNLQLMGRYKEAAAAGEEALPLHHDPGLESDLCTAYAMTGRLDDARRIVAEFDAKRDFGFSDGCRVDIAKGVRHLYEARAIMDRVAANYGKNAWSANAIALDYAIAGDYPKAILWMNRAYDNNETEVFTIHQFKEISPEFQEQPGFLAFWEKPRARAWKAAHDMVAAELAARDGSP